MKTIEKNIHMTSVNLLHLLRAKLKTIELQRYSAAVFSLLFAYSLVITPVTWKSVSLHASTSSQFLVTECDHLAFPREGS